MNICIIGEEWAEREVKGCVGDKHQLFRITGDKSEIDLNSINIILDYEFAQTGILTPGLQNFEGIYLVSSLYSSLARIREENKSLPDHLVGFSGWPGAVAGGFLEGALSTNSQRREITSELSQLGLQFNQVADRVGLVFPRVLAMIINEAYFTVQDGTAARKEIDLAMKLGTNYPLGPFAWSDLIGKQKVLRLLEALYADTGDPRYRASLLLKQEAMY